MNTPTATSQRIVIVGGGIAGLASAARLAQAGLPVTVLEASQLGGAASTRNQGWLHSGACFALQSPEYARQCHAALEQTLWFCPECVEPQTEPMAYLFARPDTLVAPWKAAWKAAGIAASELALEHVFAALPGLDHSRIQHAFQLPDRAIRLDFLLTHLAATAQNASAEIRVGTPVKSLHRDGDRIAGVITATGEEIAAQLVILAVGTSGFPLCAEFLEQRAGSQNDVEMIPLKTHLASVQPEVGRLPFCIPDADGLNHLPHPPASVFGTGHWEQATQTNDDPDSKQIELLRTKIHAFFPALAPNVGSAHAWAGTMMQALRVDQIEPGGPIWPAVIDHSRHTPHLENLLSIFPGRATLWPLLAEKTRRIVLAKLDRTTSGAAHPPWAR
jgi:glycine/D-amino acid oxidase-like deaminating enzyme